MKKTVEIKICEGITIKKNHKKIIHERIHPRLWQWDYLGLKPLLREVIKFSALARKEDSQNILDLGCGLKPYKSLFSFAKKYVGVDISRDGDADFIAPAWKLPFVDNEFDALISTQVLEHTKKINEAVLEIRRVVKKGGLIFISVPLVFPEHGIPYDYYRFTRYGLEEIFKDFDVLVVAPSSGYISTLLRMLNILLHYFPFSNYYFFPIFLVNNILALFFDKFVYFLFIVAAWLTGNDLFYQVYDKYYLGFPENYVIFLKNKG